MLLPIHFFHRMKDGESPVEIQEPFVLYSNKRKRVEPMKYVGPSHLEVLKNVCTQLMDNRLVEIGKLSYPSFFHKQNFFDLQKILKLYVLYTTKR